MKTTAAGNNLFQLTQWGAINCYLVREDDGFTLIDTANGGQEQQIMQAAQKLGLPIARILLTHAHVDHVGSLDKLHEAEEIFLTSTTRDVQAIHRVDDRELHAPGTITTQVAKIFTERSTENPNP